MRKEIAQFHHYLKTKEIGDTSKFYDDDTLKKYGSLILQSELVEEVIDNIYNRIWVVAKNDSAETFYTSDNPIVFKDKENKNWTTLKSISELGSQVIFPISSDIIIYAHERKYWKKLEKFDGKLSPVICTEYMAKHENSGQVGFSTRFIYSSKPNFQLAKEYCNSNPIICNPDRTRFERMNNEHLP
jgi:hypothetical protein